MVSKVTGFVWRGSKWLRSGAKRKGVGSHASTSTSTTTTTSNKYSVQRQAFINQINRIIPDFDKKPSPESIKLIVNSKEHHVNKLVMKFVSSCMKIRDSLLVM